MKNEKRHKTKEDLIPDTIAKIGKNNPYVVPDDYFESLTSRVISSIEASEAPPGSRKRILSLNPTFRAVAASIAILLFAGITYALITNVILPAVRLNNTPGVTQPSDPSPLHQKDLTDPSITHHRDSLSGYIAPSINTKGIPSSSSLSRNNSLAFSNPATGSGHSRSLVDHFKSGSGTIHQTSGATSRPPGYAPSYLSDTVVCQGSTLQYRILFPAEKYEALWALNGLTLQTSPRTDFTLATHTLKPGTHRLSMMLRDTHTQQFVQVQNGSITVIAPPESSKTQEICAYNRTSLSAGSQNPYYEYFWSTGEITPEIDVHKTGKYWVKVSVKGGYCFATDTFNVRVFNKPDIHLGADRTVCAGDDFSLQIKNSDPQLEIKWSPGNFKGDEYYFQKKQPGIYKITAEVTACKTYRDEMVIQVVDCNITIPNVFTPNGDGINDIFFIKGLDNSQTHKLLVTDRNGQTVFESNDYKNNWNGENLPEGTYFYILYPGGQESLYRKGTISLIR